VAGRLEVTVSDRNLENVAVSLRPAPAIAGSFKTEDGSPMTGFKQPPTLWLQAEGGVAFFSRSPIQTAPSNSPGSAPNFCACKCPGFQTTIT